MKDKLSYCRYYKGVNFNPYVDSEGFEGYFWVAEACFVDNEVDEEAVNFYRKEGIVLPVDIPIELQTELYGIYRRFFGKSRQMDFENQFISWYLTGEYPLRH